MAKLGLAANASRNQKRWVLFIASLWSVLALFALKHASSAELTTVSHLTTPRRLLEFVHTKGKAEDRIAFDIEPETRGVQRVFSNIQGVTIGCVFQYDTSFQDLEKEPQRELARDLADINTKLTALGCLKYHAGIFEYEICLGHQITQNDGSTTYSLGKFSGYQDESKHPKQLFAEGL